MAASRVAGRAGLKPPLFPTCSFRRDEAKGGLLVGSGLGWLGHIKFALGRMGRMGRVFPFPFIRARMRV